MPALVLRDAPSSEELRGTVPNGKVRKSVDELPEGEAMDRVTNREHTECVSGGFKPNFREAGRGAIVRCEAEPAATGKLKGGISQKVEGETCVRRTVSGTASPSPPLEKDVGLDEEALGIVDKLEAPVRVKRILRRGRDDPLEQVRRPWYRVKRRECPENILVLARKNYKVSADIGPTVGLMSRVLSVSDTGAGPNLIRKYELPAGLETLVSSRPTQDIGHASNRRLRTVGTIRMPVRLGRFVVTAEFIVCEKLVVPLILGADYCDRFVEAIYPRKKTVELADFVGEWVSTGVGKRDDPEGDTVEVVRLCG